MRDEKSRVSFVAWPPAVTHLCVFVFFSFMHIKGGNLQESERRTTLIKPLPSAHSCENNTLGEKKKRKFPQATSLTPAYREEERSGEKRERGEQKEKGGEKEVTWREERK